MPHVYTLFTKVKSPKVKTLVVEPAVHGMVKAYALEKNISIIEATYILIGKGVAAAYNMPEEDIDQIK